MKELLEMGEIPDDATIKELGALGDTINFIDIWLKLLREKFDARCEEYINARKFMFRQIPQRIKIAPTPIKKLQKLMTDIGGGWYMGKVLGDYHH